MLQFIVNGIIAGCIYALVALGFSLIYGTARFFNFAHGAVYTLGAYLAYTFCVPLSLPFPLAVFLAIALSSLAGAGIEFTIYRPMRKRGSSSLILLISSLGLLIVMQNIISLVWGDATKSIRASSAGEGFDIFGARITTIQLVIVFTSCGLTLLLRFFLDKTLLGLRLRAVAGDRELSQVMGIDPDKSILLSFALGSILAAAAAILISLDTDMTPTMGFYALLMGVAAAIIGGVGEISGALLGGLFVGLVQNLGVWKLPTEWQDAIVFAVVILFLLVKPQGFLGTPLKRTEA